MMMVMMLMVPLTSASRVMSAIEVLLRVSCSVMSLLACNCISGGRADESSREDWSSRGRCT